MKVLADTHVHTIASGHAYSTIDEILREASRKGVKMVAITDHTNGLPGGAHDFHFMNLRILPKEMYGVRTLIGAEVNIMDYKGRIDANLEVMEEVDFVIASLHPPCISLTEKEEVTSCIEKVMQNPLVSIIGHPGDARFPMDFERIARAAKETGTLLEVNNASLRRESFRVGVRENLIEMLHYCMQYQVQVVVASDAHISLDVGEFKESCELLEELNFPSELVINTDIEALLTFISKKRLK